MKVIRIEKKVFNNKKNLTQKYIYFIDARVLVNFNMKRYAKCYT